MAADEQRDAIAEEPGAADEAARAGLRLFGWLSGAALTAVLLTNALVNPTGVFPYELLRPLVNPVRARKVQLLDEQLDTHFDNVVLGSSRTFKVEPGRVSYWLGGETFNFGVNSGRPEDYYAALKHMLDRGFRPQRVVLGVDVEAFHNAAPIDSRLAGVLPLASKLRWVDRAPALAEGLKESLSARNLQLSLRSIGYALREYPPARQGSVTDRGFEIVRSRDAKIRRGKYDLAAKIEEDRDKYLGRFDGYTGVARWRVRYFERLLELCAAHKIELYVYITPLHPEIVALLRAARGYDARHEQVLALLRGYSERYGFALEDMSEVHMFDGDPENFYDGAHARVENTRKIIDALLGPAVGEPRGEKPADIKAAERAERLKERERARRERLKQARAKQKKARERRAKAKAKAKANSGDGGGDAKAKAKAKAKASTRAKPVTVEAKPAGEG